MRIRLPRFAISTILFVIAATAVVCSMLTFGPRQVSKTKAVYDEQKRIVDETVKKYVTLLVHEGYDVKNHSSAVGGSGEWRKYIALASTSENENELVCYVEIMGFVSHDAYDHPTWRHILPMKISHQGRELNGGFLALLLPRLDEQGWEFIIDDKINGDAYFSGRSSEFFHKKN